MSNNGEKQELVQVQTIQGQFTKPKFDLFNRQYGFKNKKNSAIGNSDFTIYLNCTFFGFLLRLKFVGYTIRTLFAWKMLVSANDFIAIKPLFEAKIAFFPPGFS